MNARGRPRRFCRAACRKAAARQRHEGYIRRAYKPKTRCAYCRRPLPKRRTRRRLYCTPSCTQKAYLRRKLNDAFGMQALVTDLKASQRRTVIAAQMARQVDQALRETPDA
jgi:hypothetical protein